MKLDKELRMAWRLAAGVGVIGKLATARIKLNKMNTAMDSFRLLIPLNRDCRSKMAVGVISGLGYPQQYHQANAKPRQNVLRWQRPDTLP